MHAMRGVHGHAARACVRVMHAHASGASMQAMHDPWPLGKKCLPTQGGKNALGKNFQVVPWPPCQALLSIG